MEDFVHVPKDLKRFVIGAKGSIIKSIEERSEARVSSLSRDEEGFRVSGTREERDLAKKLILEKVVSYTYVKSSRFICCISAGEASLWYANAFFGELLQSKRCQQTPFVRRTGSIMK